MPYSEPEAPEGFWVAPAQRALPVCAGTYALRPDTAIAGVVLSASTQPDVEACAESCNAHAGCAAIHFCNCEVGVGRLTCHRQRRMRAGTSRRRLCDLQPAGPPANNSSTSFTLSGLACRATVLRTVCHTSHRQLPVVCLIQGGCLADPTGAVIPRGACQLMVPTPSALSRPGQPPLEGLPLEASVLQLASGSPRFGISGACACGPAGPVSPSQGQCSWQLSVKGRARKHACSAAPDRGAR